MVFKCQKNEMHSLTLQCHYSRCLSNVEFLSFNKFELPHSKEDNCTRNNKCFEGTDVDVDDTVQKVQRSIVNFKSVSTVLVETLSGGQILLISDVHLTPPFSGFYKLNVDGACSIEGDKWDIDVVVRDDEGVVVAASS
ncbi:hypothetical protein MTR_2g039980 [Medicago truncatula]|nr:hypothetical protein MTR_2g039980 [Medicago truncatula]